MKANSARSKCAPHTLIRAWDQLPCAGQTGVPSGVGSSNRGYSDAAESMDSPRPAQGQAPAPQVTVRWGLTSCACILLQRSAAKAVGPLPEAGLAHCLYRLACQLA